MIKKNILLAFLLLPFIGNSFQAVAQDRDANAILQDVKNKFLSIKEYEANVKIKVDVDFVKIPVKQGTIWFKQPDKVKVKIPGFSLLPKRGMNITPNQLFSGNYTAIYVREEKIDDVPTHVIKVIPNNDTDGIILSTLWIDQKRNVIRKLETTTKSEGTILMFFRFGTVPKTFDLPEEIIFHFDLRKNELPMGLTGDFENSRPSGKESKNSKGTVTITYLEYFVNQGKADVYFKSGK